MTGIVDAGGGMRGIFSAGIYDRFIEEGINFDVCIGVSAGSANLISYVAGHHDRLRRFYINYARRKQYMSFDNLIHSGSYIGLDYIYSTLSNADGEDPLNYDAYIESPTDFITVVTDGESGKPVYFPKDSIKRDDLTVIKASCCLPAICKPVVIDGRDSFDGGISDPIPFQKAFDMGCDKVVVVISKPVDYRKSPQKHMPIIKAALSKYPNVFDRIAIRHEVYNRQLEQAIKLQEEGKIIILAPQDCHGVNTLTREPDSLEKLYEEGRRCADAHLDEIKSPGERTA